MLLNFLRRRLWLVRRVQALEAALARSERAMHQDELTAVTNRRDFRQACERHSASNAFRRLCCVMIDLDDFQVRVDDLNRKCGRLSEIRQLPKGSMSAYQQRSASPECAEAPCGPTPSSTGPQTRMVKGIGGN